MSAVSAQEWRRFTELTERAEALRPRRAGLSGAEVTELCRLHRSMSRALAQAVSDDQPYARTRQIHDLVGRAHAVLYGVRKLERRTWRTVLFEEAPRALYHDPYLRFSAALFFGLGLLSCAMVFLRPEWSEMILGANGKDMLDRMYSQIGEGRAADEGARMTAFYIRNNLTVALRCFAYGAFLGIGSLVALASNALVLGTTFGYMLGGSYRDNFLSFVTGHAVFELSAIAMAGAGTTAAGGTGSCRTGLGVAPGRGASRRIGSGSGAIPSSRQNAAGCTQSTPAASAS